MRKSEIWHKAQGKDLPETGREVIALQGLKEGGYSVVFAHRTKKPSVVVDAVTGDVLHYSVKEGWNIENIKWWLDIELPND